MTAIEYKEFGTELTLKHLDAITGLYGTVFTQAPYQDTPEQIEQVGRDIAGDSREPSYRCVTAWSGDTLVGFIYITTMESGRWIGRAVTPAPEHLAHVDKCWIREFAVLQAWRGQGIGGELMRRALANRPEPYAILSVLPVAEAKQVYRHLGWTKVGHSAPTATNPRPGMELMHRALP